MGCARPLVSIRDQDRLGLSAVHDPRCEYFVMLTYYREPLMNPRWTVVERLAKAQQQHRPDLPLVGARNAASDRTPRPLGFAAVHRDLGAPSHVDRS